MRSAIAEWKTQQPRPFRRMWLVVFAGAVMLLAIAGAGHAQDTFSSVVTINATSHDFPQPNDLGNTSPEFVFDIHNSSSNVQDTITVTSITGGAGDFSFRVNPSVGVPIPGNQHMVIGVSFIPTQLGPQSANLVMTLTHKLPDGTVHTVSSVPTITMSGTGTLPSLTALNVTPNVVTGGSPVTASVTLARPNPPLGPHVTFTSSNASVVPPPAPVTIPVSSNVSPAFPVASNPVQQDTNVQLTANYGTSQIQTTITVRAPRPITLTFNPNPVTGGSSTIGTVTLNGPAPVGGALVTLASNNTAVVPSPGSVLMSAGVTSVAFPIATNPVSSSTNVAITAVLAGNQVTGLLTVLPPPPTDPFNSVASLTIGDLDFGSVDLGNTVDKSFTVTAHLSGSPSDTLTITKISLTPTSGTGGEFSVTATPGVGAPFAGSTQVVVHFRPTALGPQSANLVMTMIHTLSNGTVSNVTGVPALGFTGTGTLPPLKSLTVTPAPLFGGSVATLSVTLARPNPPLGAIVTFTSSNPSVVPLSSSVAMPVGATATSLRVQTNPVSVDTNVTITATYGPSQLAKVITVLHLKPSALTFNPNPVIGGSSTTATITLNGPAPAGGVLVAFSRNNTAVVPLPASVTVPAGATRATFRVTPTSVASTTRSTVNASFGGNTVSSVLTVAPQTGSGILTSLAPSATRVIGGDRVAFTVTWNVPVTSNGVLVTFDTSNGLVVPQPPDLLIPQGATFSRSLSVRTPKVSTEQPVEITASAGGASFHATLVVAPLPPTQIAAFHPSPSGGDAQWLILGDDGLSTSALFGSPGDLPVPGNYLGLGHAQIAFWRPSTGQWHVRDDTGNDLPSIPFGNPTDLPKPADYLGLGHAQPAFFRPAPTATDTAVWGVLDDTGIPVSVAFGLKGDVPVPGDYLGLGLAQVAVYRPSAGQWHVLDGSGKDVPVQFGQPNDIPVPADYLGTGHVQVAVYRPATGDWVIHPDDGTPDLTVQLGVAAQANDVPVPGDYLGLGQAQIGVFRPATAEWFFRPLRDAGAAVPVPFGTPGDVPVPAAYLPGFGM